MLLKNDVYSQLLLHDLLVCGIAYRLWLYNWQASSISKLVKITGIVIAASRTKAKATSVTLLCKNCKNIKVVACRPGLGGAVVPRSCDHITQVCYFHTIVFCSMTFL
jgi:DNA replicative helicase MCM subunit Mcm2 (Cdc46/Mcm family)